MRAAVVLAALAACSSTQAAGSSPIDGAPQLVVGVLDGWDATTVELQVWTRDGDGWKKQGDAWPAVIGSAGAGWGDGLHGTGAPDGRKGPVKHEGDKKSPAGVFAVRGAFGYASKADAKIGYTAVDAKWQCVDDAKSAHYTQILDKSKVAKVDWTSAEEMRRDDALYTWVIDLAHNAGAVPGDGSCIFFHVWSGPKSTTVGCTAMAKPKIEALLGELQPGAAYVLLTKSDYAELRSAWKLP